MLLFFFFFFKYLQKGFPILEGDGEHPNKILLKGNVWLYRKEVYHENASSATIITSLGALSSSYPSSQQCESHLLVAVRVC